jgi:cytochrome c553
MGCKTSLWCLALLLPLLLVETQVFADQRPGKHKHDHKAPHGKPAEEYGHTTGGTHQHPWWEPPPAEYANARSTRWGDTAAIARGQQLFQTYCLMCHGADGKGTGRSPRACHIPQPT